MELAVLTRVVHRERPDLRLGDSNSAADFNAAANLYARRTPNADSPAADSHRDGNCGDAYSDHGELHRHPLRHCYGNHCPDGHGAGPRSHTNPRSLCHL